MCERGVPSEALLGSGERRETASWSFLGRALSRAVMTRPTVRVTMDSGGTDSHINRWSSSIASSVRHLHKSLSSSFNYVLGFRANWGLLCSVCSGTSGAVHEMATSSGATRMMT